MSVISWGWTVNYYCFLFLDSSNSPILIPVTYKLYMYKLLWLWQFKQLNSKAKPDFLSLSGQAAGTASLQTWNNHKNIFWPAAKYWLMIVICQWLLPLWRAQWHVHSDSDSDIGGGDSSMVRAPDSWLKGRGFESLLERQENFLLQGRLSVLTLISVSVPPPCYRSST